MPNLTRFKDFITLLSYYRPKRGGFKIQHMTEGNQVGRTNPVFRYLQGAKEELKKVTWPSADQVRKSTIAVLIVSASMAIFLGLIDYFLNLGLQQIL